MQEKPRDFFFFFIDLGTKSVKCRINLTAEVSTLLGWIISVVTLNVMSTDTQQQSQALKAQVEDPS